MKSLDIIDTHFHIWNPEIINIPWLGMFDGKLKSSYSIHEYMQAISGFNIKKSCYVEVDAIEAQHQLESEMILELCHDSSNQVMGATIPANLALEGFTTYIEAFAKDKAVKSVRHNFFLANPDILRQAIFIKNVQMLGELGIMCDLVMPAEKISYGVELARTCPDTTFVVNHCGVCPILGDKNTKSVWRNGIEQYGLQANVICKISECGFTNPDYQWQIADVVEIIKHCLTTFGENRVVYGTNWPVCEMMGSIEHWLEALEVCLMDYPEHFAKKLFYDNAQKYYDL